MSEKPDIADRLLKWIGVVGAIGGLGIGAWLLEAKHSIQADEIKYLIVSENEKHSKAIQHTVIVAIKNDLRTFRDSINKDHSELMQANYQKDSMLLIVMPRMLEQVKESTQLTKRLESQIKATTGDQTSQIWQYLREKERMDSIYSRDAQIMRELRQINEQLLNDRKIGDRPK